MVVDETWVFAGFKAAEKNACGLKQYNLVAMKLCIQELVRAALARDLSATQRAPDLSDF